MHKLIVRKQNGEEIACIVTKSCAILEASPAGEISVDGDRKATITIRIKPVGGDSLSGTP